MYKAANWREIVWTGRQIRLCACVRALYVTGWAVKTEESPGWPENEQNYEKTSSSDNVGRFSGGILIRSCMEMAGPFQWRALEREEKKRIVRA